MNNRAGNYRSNLSGDMSYQSFIPSPLPPNPPIEFDTELIDLLTKATNQIAQLQGMTSQIPDIKLFVSMYVRKEALLSSQIEGTQATLEDILDPMVEQNANADVSDVINYIQATEYALKRVNELPLCNRLIKEIHSILMKGVRESDKNPGELRRSQNWIGPQGSTLKDAIYIPPSVDDMIEAMSDLEKYMNSSEDSLNVLIRISLIHYQFETIHPFLDGNGRIGRLLILLFLILEGSLSSPALYVSYFLKKNRVEYYDRMTEVRRNGNYEQWIKFFLRALSESAEDAIDTINKLQKLHEQNLADLNTLGRSKKTALILFSYLETNPIIEIGKTSEDLELSFNTVSNAINEFVKRGILQQTAEASRNRTFAYEDYLTILRKDT